MGRSVARCLGLRQTDDKPPESRSACCSLFLCASAIGCPDFLVSTRSGGAPEAEDRKQALRSRTLAFIREIVLVRARGLDSMRLLARAAVALPSCRFVSLRMA